MAAQHGCAAFEKKLGETDPKLVVFRKGVKLCLAVGQPPAWAGAPSQKTIRKKSLDLRGAVGVSTEAGSSAAKLEASAAPVAGAEAPSEAENVVAKQAAVGVKRDSKTRKMTSIMDSCSSPEEAGPARWEFETDKAYWEATLKFDQI